MESNLTLGNMMAGGSAYRGSEFQGSMRVNHPQNPLNLQQNHHSQPSQGLLTHPSISEVFPMKMGQGQGHNCDHSGSKGKNTLTDEDDHSSNEEGGEGQNGHCKGKAVHQWQRVKWTNTMVKLLITAVSYLSEELGFECGSGLRRKNPNLHKKGKWKSISKVMAERGFYVSPQQCEDKFNDLNKRYKKLNDILGRGISCQVVEKPALLDMMDHLSNKTKDEVRKILSSKHLFYEEMCSYHNNNRLHLPHDPALQQSLQLAMRVRDDNDTDSRKDLEDIEEDIEEGDHDDDRDEYEASHGREGGVYGDPFKRVKPVLGHEHFNFGSQSTTQDLCKGFQFQSQNQIGDMNASLPDHHQRVAIQNQGLGSQQLSLEERKLKIKMEFVELEKQRYKWNRLCKRKDRELDKYRAENEKMKLNNECLALDLRRLEVGLNLGNQ